VDEIRECDFDTINGKRHAVATPTRGRVRIAWVCSIPAVKDQQIKGNLGVCRALGQFDHRGQGIVSTSEWPKEFAQSGAIPGPDG